MIPVTITAIRPGRWWRREKVVEWKRKLPERWEDVSDRRRPHYYRLLLSENGLRSAAIQLLGLPAWAIRAMKPDQWAALENALSWMSPVPDCAKLPFKQFAYNDITFFFPGQKGENISCLEYAIADEYFTEFVSQDRDSALLLLCATICREGHRSRAERLRRDDQRAPLHSRAEVIERASYLRGLPVEYQMASLMYFAGLKEYVNKTYGPWLFDDDDADEEYQPKKNENSPPPAPNFGWWGVYQDVAEAGLFGTIEQVYQASFHDVAMWLVRQTIKSEAVRQSGAPIKKAEDDDL